MKREEMLKRLKAGESPLELSIEKWQDIVDGKGEDQSSLNCALCETTPIDAEDECNGCIVKETTGEPNCLGTPYHDHADEDWAKRELEFLKYLRKKEKITKPKEG